MSRGAGKVAIVAADPAFTLGFTAVATNVARQLARIGWDVSYVAIGERFGDGGTEDGSDSAVLRQLARLAASSDDPLPVVMFGRPVEAMGLAGAAAGSSLRHRLRFTYYATADYAPLPAWFRSFPTVIDQVVPATHYAQRLLAELGPTAPIPHGVDVAVFRPRSGASREDTRRVLGVPADCLLVGFFGRNVGHKRPDLALRAFAHLRRGSFGRCRSCQCLTVGELDCLDLSFLPVRQCRHCDSTALVEGQPHPAARMYLHTDRPDRRQRAAAGGWDLEGLARRFGVTDSVVLAPPMAVGRGLPVADLAARMAACDIHLLLYECGGWELTVLETGACGVANIVTDTAAPPEYAAAFSRLVPVASTTIGPYGARGVADLDGAVEALIELAEDPRIRAALGARGSEVAASYSWERIGEQWDRLLRTGAP